MEIAKISGEARQASGRNANQRLRRRGLIPAVVYGHGEQPESVALSLHELKLALGKQAHVVSVAVGGKETQYLLKEIQYDHLQQTPIHADLMRVDLTERVRVKVPIEFKGTAPGVKEGGVLLHILNDVEIECTLLSIPDSIRANVGELAMNQSLHVRELEIGEGISVLHHQPDDLVAVVRPPKTHETPLAAAPAVEGAAAASAEPEVIKKGKEEEAEAGE